MPRDFQSRTFAHLRRVVGQLIDRRSRSHPEPDQKMPRGPYQNETLRPIEPLGSGSSIAIDETEIRNSNPMPPAALRELWCEAEDEPHAPISVGHAIRMAERGERSSDFAAMKRLRVIPQFKSDRSPQRSGRLQREDHSTPNPSPPVHPRIRKLCDEHAMMPFDDKWLPAHM
ncbi:MAG: hypothetical protein SGPRY_012143, partial [Prymnesium sp.]